MFYKDPICYQHPVPGSSVALCAVLCVAISGPLKVVMRQFDVVAANQSETTVAVAVIVKRAAAAVLTDQHKT